MGFHLYGDQNRYEKILFRQLVTDTLPELVSGNVKLKIVFSPDATSSAVIVV